MIKKTIYDCCGCTACLSVCKHNAITFHPDALGFLYPYVDKDKCVDCGLCDIVCQFNSNYKRPIDYVMPSVFMARHKDINQVERSQSGACFIALTDWILDMGGVVYGAGFGKHFKVMHSRAVTKEERDRFRGSKYAQSELCDIFLSVKKDLDDNRLVLFSGTPCQTSGLLGIIKENRRKNLFLVDIICHGVASPKVWNDYVNYIEKKEGLNLISVSFRDKAIFGWSGLHKESFTFSNRVIKTYPIVFYQPYLLRYSCYNCPYTNLQRPSDITLGDFWGWQRVNNEMNKDDKGVSLVLCNSNKGLFLFKQIKDDLKVIPTDIEHCIQPNLLRPTEQDCRRKDFEEDYINIGFKALIKYNRRNFLEIIKGQVRKLFFKLRHQK